MANSHRKFRAARVLPVTGHGGPKHPSVFSADRVDILNVHKLLFCFKLQPKKPWSTAIDIFSFGSSARISGFARRTSQRS